MSSPLFTSKLRSAAPFLDICILFISYSIDSPRRCYIQFHSISFPFFLCLAFPSPFFVRRRNSTPCRLNIDFIHMEDISFRLCTMPYHIKILLNHLINKSVLSAQLSSHHFCETEIPLQSISSPVVAWLILFDTSLISSLSFPVVSYPFQFHATLSMPLLSTATQPICPPF